MNEQVDSKSPADLDKVEAQPSHIDHAVDLDEKAKLSAFRAGAMEAETTEHNMGVLEAVKLYPMAAFWAFVMSSTIVRYPSNIPEESRKKVVTTNILCLDYGGLLCLLDGLFRRHG
jgi:hypothetical protein